MWLVGDNHLLQALVGGAIIAGLNLLGAVLVLVWRNPSERALDGALGFAAGVMLAASFTSLLIPGIEFAARAAYDPFAVGPVELVGVVPVLVGFVAGVAVLERADRWVPHVHVLVTGRRRSEAARADPGDSAVILFIVAITLHNMPEGLAVGVAFGAGDVANAIALMLAIGMQNIPEGFAVSVAAVNAGFDKLSYAALAGIRAGLVEIPLALLGAAAVSLVTPLLPYAMGFAAGGMLYVISDEIIPETHSRGYERVATLGTMLGIGVMVYLDTTLG